MKTRQITATHQRLTRLWHGQPPAAEGAGLMALLPPPRAGAPLLSGMPGMMLEKLLVACIACDTIRP